MSLARLLILLAGATAPALSCAAADRELVQRLQDTEFVAADAAVPPPADDSGWRPRPLPDDWNQSQPGYGGIGWYRDRITLTEPPTEPWAVYVPRFWMTAVVYVNGVAMGGSKKLTIPDANSWNRPLLVVVPATSLRAGTNEIQIGVWSYADAHGGLGVAEVGPEAALRPVFERRFFLKVTLPEVLLGSTLLMALLIGVLWVRRRQDSVYGWFALSCLLWSVKIFSFLSRDPRVATWVWAWLANAVNYWVGIATAIMIHRYFGVQRPRFERAILIYATAATVLLPLFDLNHVYLAGVVLEVGVFLLVLYAVALVLVRAWVNRRSDEIVFAAGIGFLVAIAVHDTLLDLGVLAHQDWYLMHYGSFVACLILAWLLTSRFVSALNASEAMSAELAQRVEQKHRELEQSYGQMRELERQQAIADERERILRDLHDGLGGQLVAALAISQSAQATQPAIEQTLRDALDDLRMVIDSLDPVDGDLLVLLGTVRGRLEPRLSQHGVRIDWRVEEIPAIPGFGPDKALQVLRILQEAIGNVIKHARARTVTIRTGCEAAAPANGAAVFIDVADDGVGIVAERPGGRGLKHMRQRAERIGGRLDLTTSETGTSVRLWLPLAGAA